jgi:hypothetical protein
MNYLVPNRAGSHGIVRWCCCYCSLSLLLFLVSQAEVPRCSMGVLWAEERSSTFCGGVIDKAGFNQLFVPHQSPSSPYNQSTLFLLYSQWLQSATPTPSPLTLLAIQRGDSPPPRSLSTGSSFNTVGVQESPHIPALWTSTRGPNNVCQGQLSSHQY